MSCRRLGRWAALQGGKAWPWSMGREWVVRANAWEQQGIESDQCHEDR